MQSWSRADEIEKVKPKTAAEHAAVDRGRFLALAGALEHHAETVYRLLPSHPMTKDLRLAATALRELAARVPQVALHAIVGKTYGG